MLQYQNCYEIFGKYTIITKIFQFKNQKHFTEDDNKSTSV